MKKVLYKSIKNFLAIIFFSFLTYSFVQAQTYQSGDLPIPHMWIDKVRSDTRIKSFMDTKYQLLCDAIEQPEATSKQRPMILASLRSSPHAARNDTPQGGNAHHLFAERPSAGEER